MKQVRFLTFCVISFLLSACNDLSLNNETDSKLQGTLSLELSVDGDGTVTRGDASSDEDQIDLEQFWVEIYKKVSDEMDSGIRIYRKQYSEAKEGGILLNEGDYYLRAKLGDSLGVGFNRPFYMAEEEFTIRPQDFEHVNACAYLSNVMVSVNFGENFKEYYPDYYVRVKHTDPKIKSTLKFKKDETRSGYIHHGAIVLEVCADFKGTGDWRYYILKEMDFDGDGNPEPLEYSPNDHITFNIDADIIYGSDILVNFLLNDETIDHSKAVLVPEHVAPQDAPTMTRQGFDEDGACYVYENRDIEYTGGQSFSYNAKAGVASCLLNIDSWYLTEQLGLPSEVELVGIDGATKELLNEAGIRFSIGQFLGVVDFSDAMRYLGMNVVYEDSYTPCAEFSLLVTDVAGELGEIGGEMLVWPELKGILEINDHDVWATKVVNPVFTATKGYPEFSQLQVSVDGNKWETLENPGFVSGSSIIFEEIPDLAPGTSYWFRVVDGEYSVCDPVKVTTEYPLQLGNPSFEEFRLQNFKFQYTDLVMNGWRPQIVTKTEYRIWYDLFNDTSSSSNTKWATNSSASMDANVTPQYLYYKCYPTVTLQKDDPYHGSYCIMVASVATTDLGSEVLSGDAVTGELFIGTADNSAERRGYHTSEGDEFTSRPSALTFMNKFSCYQNDPYHVEVQVLDAGKNVIGRGVKNDQTTSVESDWQKVTVPIEYSIKDRKAAYIYVIFRSSATDNEESRKFSGDSSLKLYNTHVEKSGASYVSVGNDPIHAGNILWLDDIRLEY